jgi:16S rRNA (cytidine1402-2'-O)-methyltransferase
MPAVSDPGSALVDAAVRAQIQVLPIPGASALTAAVAASGLVTGGFRFFGFLPRRGSERAEALTDILATPEAVVFFESPRRLAETLAELSRLCPERRLVVAREMTKVHEELVRGTVAEVASLGREWLGEVTLVLGPDAAARAGVKAEDDAIDRRIEAELAREPSAKTVAQRIAAWSGRSRREIYERVVSAKSGKSSRR